MLLKAWHTQNRNCLMVNSHEPKIFQDYFSSAARCGNKVPHYLMQVCLCITYIIRVEENSRYSWITIPTGSPTILLHGTWNTNVHDFTNMGQSTPIANATVTKSTLILPGLLIRSSRMSFFPFSGKLAWNCANSLFLATFAKPLGAYCLLSKWR